VALLTAINPFARAWPDQGQNLLLSAAKAHSSIQQLKPWQVFCSRVNCLIKHCLAGYSDAEKQQPET
jgi:hypothetical protein